MHKEILAKEQLEILQFLSTYKKKYYLVGEVQLLHFI